jgi:eukaryotic-like serine/threonine-protein kinase
MGDEANPAMKPVSSEQALFAEALQCDTPEDRTAYLDAACGTDTALRQRVEALLRAAESAGDFLEEPPTGLTAADESTSVVSQLSEKAGDKIGRYKLLQQIGEGGCGVVYMAEQLEPVRRRVALKVIKLGMDTKNVIARFEAERQALALMDHPNIAKVLDAGATETGRPYFVMELVRGIKITDYCDQNNISTEERLKLFTQICDAIQHAHQKGIIHRDIKPSNILVTKNESVAVPKVIDFGIAKATTDQRLTDKTVFTAFEQFIGTPAYMSPEQAMMTSLDIDTRTDIYALGVLLYELLTGQTPFDAKDLMAAGLDAMRRTIREQEPARPSTRLSTMLAADLTTVAKHRHSEPAKLGTLLRGDLDWIVMKALEKDRTRRYETASALAMDLQRHLNSEPVLACPPSQSYRFQKMVRRNKLAFAASSAVVAALVIGLGISTWMYFREIDARRRATQAEKLAMERLAEVSAERDAKEAARKEAEVVSTFISQLFQSRDPSRASGIIPVADRLAVAAKKLELDLVDKPARRAKLQAALGDTYSALGHHSEAVLLREKVSHYYETSAGPERPETLLAMQLLASAYHDAGSKDEALKLREKVLSLRRKVLGMEHPDTVLAMNHLADSYTSGNHQEPALELREKVLGLCRRTVGPEDPDTVLAMQALGNSLFAFGRWKEALKLREEVLVVRRKILSAEHPDTLSAIAALADSYLRAGQFADAIPLLTDASTRNPGDTVSALTVAAVQVWVGNEADHVVTCQRMLKWAANAKKSEDVERVAKLSCLRPIDDIQRRDATLALARKAVKLAQGNGAVLPWAHVALGMAEYRSGHDAAADEALTTAKNTAATTGPYRSHTEGTASFYRAMSLFRQGKQTEAREVFNGAQARMKPLPANEKDPLAAAGTDHEDLILWLAFKEARTLLNESGKPEKP